MEKYEPKQQKTRIKTPLEEKKNSDLACKKKKKKKEDMNQKDGKTYWNKIWKLKAENES